MIPGECISVRAADNSGFAPSMPYSEACALVIRGEVEGVATRNGRIRHLRMLPEQARVEEIACRAAIDKSSSTAFAKTNLGVYRQPVREAIVAEDAWGMRMAVASGEIVGHVYAFR